MTTENTAAETVAEVSATKKVKAPKVLTQTDKIAIRIIEGIRENRDAWIKSESSNDNSSKTSFDSVIGTAKITVSRVEVKGKKSKEIIARASIVVTPEVGKPLTITGPLAARAWFALTHVPAVRTKAEVDQEAVDAAAAALGL